MPIKNLGLAYILLSVLFASLMVILIKYLSESMNIYSILFYRGFFGFVSQEETLYFTRLPQPARGPMAE